MGGGEKGGQKMTGERWSLGDGVGGGGKMRQAGVRLKGPGETSHPKRMGGAQEEVGVEPMCREA